MIVDVLRNDLGRVARTGSVAVPELLALRSYAAVHHLVARVAADLRDGRDARRALVGGFPGRLDHGRSQGAGDRDPRASSSRARAACTTGSLIWLDDDGSMASSILIRSAIVSRGRVRIGAGGGVVADSEPEAEWSEANREGARLTRALGFEPEEAA